MKKQLFSKYNHQSLPSSFMLFNVPLSSLSYQLFQKKKSEIQSTFIIKEWDCEHIQVLIHFEDFECLLMEETLCVTALSQHEKALQTLVGGD